MTTTPTVWKSNTRANTSDAGTGGNSQHNPKIVSLTNGNFVVLWVDHSNDGPGEPPQGDIIGQLYDPLGEKIGDEFLANAGFNARDEDNFSVGALNDGGFVIVFEGYDIYTHTRLFAVEWDSELTATGSRQIPHNTGVTYPHAPSVSVNANGTYVISYQELGISRTTTNSRYINPAADTIGDEQLLINSYEALDEADITSARLSNGNHIVAARLDVASGDDAIMLWLLSPVGTRIGTATGAANTNHNGSVDSQPALAALSGGGFVLAWVNTDIDDDVYFQRFANDRTALGSPVLIDGIMPNDDHVTPCVAALDDGGFVIAWDDNNDEAIKGQRYDSSGRTVGSIFTIASDPAFGFAREPALATLSDGRFAAVWTDNVSGNDDIRFVIRDPRTNPVNGTEHDDVLTGRIEASTINGLAGDDTLFGSDSGDNLVGGAGSDIMYGRGGDDTFFYNASPGAAIGEQLFGGSGYDQIYLTGPTETSFDFIGVSVSSVEEIKFANDGANNNKLLRLSADDLGEHTYFHIDGNDDVGSTERFRIEMDSSSSLNLSGWTFENWGGQADMITIIGDSTSETIYGSSQGDWIIGGGGEDRIFGEGGDDELESNQAGAALFGGAGNDRLADTSVNAADINGLFGGEGDDTYIVNSTRDAIDIVYEDGIASGGVDDQDTIISVGAFFWDYYSVGETLIIDARAPENAVMISGKGDSTINGSIGADYLLSWGGTNTINPGSGSDSIGLSLYGLDASFDGVNTVVINPGDNINYIYDFETGMDKIDLSSSSRFSSGAEIVDYNLVDQSWGCYLYLGSFGLSSEYLVFMDLQASDLDAGDFLV